MLALNRLRLKSSTYVVYLVNALVTSRLDYCNLLLFGTSASNINRLQRLQNSVARLVTRQARRDSAMPLLRELHWLPVHHRVTYKIAELTFRSVSYLPTAVRAGLYTCQVSSLSVQLHPCCEQIPHCRWGLHFCACSRNGLCTLVPSGV